MSKSKKVSQDFKKIFNKEETSDVIILCEDKPIYAHKILLAAKSPVFYSMFYGKMEESQTKDGKLKLEEADAKHSDMLEVIRYIYTGEPFLTPENVMGVLSMAKKYDLPHLATLCSENISFEINRKNVYSLLEQAMTMNATELKENCISYIAAHIFKITQDEFNGLEEEVILALLERDTLACDEKELLKRCIAWGKHQCSIYGKEVTNENVRIYLERILRKIRFGTFELEYLCKEVIPLEILSDAETVDIFRKIVLKENYEPKYFDNKLGEKRKIPSIRVLLLGWASSGKTTIYNNRLTLGECISTIPTIGYNVETITYNNFDFTITDIGSVNLKKPSLLRMFYSGTRAIIYVVDSNDRDGIEESKNELHKILSDEALKDVLLAVFANKQDLPHAMSVGEVREKLELYKFNTWYIKGTCATTGDGLNAGLECIIIDVCKGEK